MSLGPSEFTMIKLHIYMPAHENTKMEALTQEKHSAHALNMPNIVVFSPNRLIWWSENIWPEIRYVCEYVVWIQNILIIQA